MSPFIPSKAVQRGDRYTAAGVFLLLLAVYTATFSGLPDNPDAEVEFQTTSALARTGSFALGGTPEAEAIVNVAHQGRQGFDVRRGGPGKEDRFYSWFGVGQALVGLPFYAAGRLLEKAFTRFEERHRETTAWGVGRSEYFEHLLVGWRNPLLGALTAALIVLVSRHLGAHRKSAAFGGLTYGLCTFAWPQARSTLSDVQATAFLFLAWFLVLQVRESLARYRRPGIATLIGLGLSLGVTFLTRAVLAPAVALLWLVFLLLVFKTWRRTRRASWPVRELLLGSFPLAACGGLFLWINQARFGDPLETGYGEVLRGFFFSLPPHIGLARLLASPGAGLIYMAPGVLLVLPWARLRPRWGGRVPQWVALGIFVCVAGPPSLTRGWYGAWTYGPRYLLPALPFLWMAVPLVLDAWMDRPAARRLAVVLVGSGLLTSLPGVLVDYSTHNDLAVQAARIAWPRMEGATEMDQEESRFQKTKLDWRFAAPWAHWRIFRHRVAGLGERFPVREIFFLPSEEILEPVHERERDMLHFAWVDFARRLHGPLWPAAAAVILLAGTGLFLLVRGLDPDQP